MPTNSPTSTEPTAEEIKLRIQALRSKQKRVGPFRAAGIQLSIDSFKAKLKGQSQ